MRSISFNKLKGHSRLFRDFIEFENSIRDYFIYDFRDLSSYKQVASILDKFHYDRSLLKDIILNSTSLLNLTAGTKENLNKISAPNSLIVFAGQQVGLLLNPMLSVFKAITAYKLALNLEKELNRPVVPCFWMATDDHDFDEIKFSKFLDRAGECLSIEYEPQVEISNKPIAALKFDSKIGEFNSNIRSALIETEFTETVISLVNQYYKVDVPIPIAFANLLNKVIGTLGVVPIDPNYPKLKHIMKPEFIKDIELNNSIFNQFEKRVKELTKTGYHRQVHKSASNVNLFFDDGIRKNIIVEGDLFRIGENGPRITKFELLELIEKSPQQFSPNVLLRPLVQCAAFPVVAQIVGPSEAAYFAQIEPLFRIFDVPWPVIRPRIFATLIEPHIAKLISKYDMNLVSLFNDSESEISRIIQAKYSAKSSLKIAGLQKNIRQQLEKIKDETKISDPEESQTVVNYGKKIDHEFNQLIEKIESNNRKKHDVVRGQIKKSANYIFPNDNFQERELSPIYYANKYGLDIFEKIEIKLSLDSFEHQLVDL